MTEDKLTRNISISIFLISLASEIAWAVENQFYNDFLSETLIGLDQADIVPLAIALLVNITTIVGTIATIIIGSYSDVIGKRKPLLLYGIILWAITTALFPVSALFSFLGAGVVIFTAILFDSIMTFFGATTRNAGLNAYVTDITTLKTRPKAMGIVQITLLVSFLIVYGALGLLVDFIGYYVFFIIIGLLVGIIGILGVKNTKESIYLKPMTISTFQHIRNTFKKKSSVDYKNFIIVLLIIAAWQIGLYVFFPYLLIYLRYTVGGGDLLGGLIIMAVAVVVSIILSIPLGKLTNKLGRKKMTLISTLFFSLGIFLLGLSPELITLIIAGIITFVFYTGLSISTFTWIKDLYPEEGRGQFSGYWNLFSGTIPMIIGPIIGGTVYSLFGVEAIFNGNPVLIPPDLLFYVAAFVTLITLIPLIFAKEIKIER
ncbi:MAG: MFS transporter [Promethearchaeota archaeon]|nr:MAG: MFS transporter [Candidatus Lokiarchaeota archaeon]